VAAGRYVIESPQAHLARLQAMIASDVATSAAAPQPSPTAAATRQVRSKPPAASAQRGEFGKRAKRRAG